MKIYHYASVRDWEDIKKENSRTKQPGLSPRRRLGRIHNKAYAAVAVFALLEATPKNWTHNNKFPDIWSQLKKDIGKMLLEIEIDENDPNIFVIDRGEMEAFLYENNSVLSEEEKDAKRERAEGQYIETKIPLAEYLKHPDRYPYVLPEVIFTKGVPIDKITISAEQPLLHESIEQWPEGGMYQKQTIKEIISIPELKVWYETKYLKRKNEKPHSELHQKLR